MAILSSAIAVLLPAVQRVRGAAARARCQNNLRQLATAAHNYHADANRLPGTPAWIAQLKVHLEQAAAGPEHTIPGLVCPADTRGPVAYRNAGGRVYGLTWYVGLGSTSHARSDGLIVMPGVPPVRLDRDVPDGTSQTVLCGDRPPPPNLFYGYWVGTSSRDTLVGAAEPYLVFTRATNTPAGPPCPNPAGFGPGGVADYCAFNSAWSGHPGGANFAFGDGSVRFVTHAGGGDLLPELVTRAGGEVVPAGP